MLNATQMKALAAIDRNTQAQAHLVDDLLDSQRILCGKLELDLQRVPLPNVLAEALESVQPSARPSASGSRCPHDPGLGVVRADPDRLRQALVKLLSNAVKFTPEDGIVILRSERRPHGLAIRVSDTGIGLEPAQIPFVFDRFQRADSSNTRRTGGLGLGLTLAEQLVQLHGGRISVESPGPGRGTTFTVELPARLLEPQAAVTAAGDAPAPLAGKRIVIVRGRRRRARGAGPHPARARRPSCTRSTAPPPHSTTSPMPRRTSSPTRSSPTSHARLFIIISTL
jgi:signal transduction histidine kinase